MPQATPVMAGAEPFDLAGGGVGVLLCHGFTSTPQSMRDWGEHLAAAGLTVRCPLLPGHGTRWQDANASTEDDWYGELSAALDDLRGRCTAVVVAGLSMGGTLATRLAEVRPDDVAGLLLVNPALGAVDPLARFAGVLKYLVPATPSIGNDIAKEGVDEGAYDMTPVAGVHELHKLWADVRSCLDLVTCPIALFRS